MDIEQAKRIVSESGWVQNGDCNCGGVYAIKFINPAFHLTGYEIQIAPDIDAFKVLVNSQESEWTNNKYLQSTILQKKLY